MQPSSRRNGFAYDLPLNRPTARQAVMATQAPKDFFFVSPAPDISEQPAVRLSNWRVLQDANGRQFLAGLDIGAQTLRITTAIVRMGPTPRDATTRSGRQYRIEGEPARDARELDNLRRVAAIRGLTDPIDATEVAWDAIQASDEDDITNQRNT